MHGRTRLAAGLDAVLELVRRWKDTGATHLSIDTMGLVPGAPVSIDRHIAALAELADALSLPPGPVS
jgi:hypothetical protein